MADPWPRELELLRHRHRHRHRGNIVRDLSLPEPLVQQAAPAPHCLSTLLSAGYGSRTSCLWRIDSPG
ncbi:unnamed protein product [Urochloa humidicola]